MFDIDVEGWIVAVVCALVVGMSKCGIPGLGSLATPLLISVLPAKAATGAVLPMLVAGDIIGTICFRKHVNKKVLLKVLPISIVGIWLGYILLGCPWMDDLVVRYSTAAIVLSLLILSAFKETLGKAVEDASMHSGQMWTMSIFFGLLGGLTTMISNGAGPVAMLYFLAMRLPKNDFISTHATYFLVINSIKVPFMLARSMITQESLYFNLKLLPIVFAGAALGFLLSKRLSDKRFKTAMETLTVIAAALLFFPPGFISNTLRTLFQ